jgi:hypothetical protein
VKAFFPRRAVDFMVSWDLEDFLEARAEVLESVLESVGVDKAAYVACEDHVRGALGDFEGWRDGVEVCGFVEEALVVEICCELDTGAGFVAEGCCGDVGVVFWGVTFTVVDGTCVEWR